MDLLQNAIESIQVGVEDFKAATRPRLLSAVRNIQAGILLLFKEKLKQLSPVDSKDALMMAKILPFRDKSGKIAFVGIGAKTVDTQQIRDRFDALGIKTDWKRLERINEVRNDVEHRYPQLDQKALEGVISDSFLLVRDFVAKELADDPLTLLGPETWQAMLEVAEVHQREKQECETLLQNANWPSPIVAKDILDLHCPACSGDLLKPLEDSGGEISLQCSSCGEEQSPESYVPDVLASALRHEACVAMDDGGDPPVVRCPECGEKAFLTEEWRCVLCGAEPERKCSLCGNSIPVEELFLSPHCGYCEYILHKDD